MTLLFGAGFMGSILYLTQFNQQVFGADATGAGLMLLPMVGGMMISSITTGQIVSRIGRYKRFIIAGFTLASLSIFALITLRLARLNLLAFTGQLRMMMRKRKRHG